MGHKILLSCNTGEMKMQFHLFSDSFPVAIFAATFPDYQFFTNQNIKVSLEGFAAYAKSFSKGGRV